MKASQTILLIAAAVIVGGIGAWKVTKGLRNNNPGNIRYNPANNWQGQTGNDGTGFAVFDSPQNGIRALAKLLKNYQNTYGLHSLQEIISRWAPPSENDTAAYISSVSQQTGFSPMDTINLNDPATLTAVVKAIIKHENGVDPYTVAVIDNGVGMA